MKWRKKSKKEQNKKEPNGRLASSGQSQNRVNAYYTASNKQLDAFNRSARLGNEEPTKKIPIKKILKATLIVIIFGLMLFGLLVLYGSPRVEIKGGEPYRSMQEYESISISAINNNLANKFKPTLQTDEIADNIKQNVPEATSVSVSARVFGGSPEVSIIVSPAFSVFSQTGTQSTVLTNRGRLAIDVNNTTLDTSRLPLMENQSGYSYSIGDQVFKPVEMESMREIQHQFLQAGDSSINYILPEKPREIWVIYKNYKIVFGLDIGASIETQFGAFKAVQSEIEQGRQAPPQEYIDVRLGDKIFIK